MRHLQAPAGRLSTTVVQALILVSAASCGSPPATTLERIQRDGFVRVAYAHEPPYAFLGDGGEVVGESPLALRNSLSALNVDSVRWSRMPFDDLLPALEDGRVDVVASGLFRTDVRSKTAAFTRPTSCSRAALLVRENELVRGGLEAFADAGGGRLAVVRGTVEQEAARRVGVPDERLLVVPDLPTGVVVVRKRRADALAMTEPTLRGSLGTEPGLRWMVYTPSRAISGLVAGCSALVVRGADIDLLTALNRGIGSFVGSVEHLAGLDSLGFVPPAGKGHRP